MGVASWFREFCDNIRVKNEDVISKRYKAITRRLNTDFWRTRSETSHSLQVGSYGRNTAIDGTSDVDMIFELPESVYQRFNDYKDNGQSALLQAVRSALMNLYSRTKIGADGKVVEIPFSDGITFEVVPGFRNKDGSYRIPDSNGGGRWMRMNPRPEIRALSNRNRECNNNLVPLCRMMRAWKQEWNVPMGGLLIDTLAYQFIATWRHRREAFSRYDVMCRDYFKYLASQDPDQEYWKALGSGQWVYAGRRQFQYKAKRCHKIVVEAMNYASKDQTRSAKLKWRKVFGNSFPR